MKAAEAEDEAGMCEDGPSSKFATCEDCGWHGSRKRLKVGEIGIRELCPKCGSFWVHDDDRSTLRGR
jgi:predicted Zn-ribbon and HTH transcriptional regulator